MTNSGTSTPLLDAALKDFFKRGGRMVFWVCSNGCRDIVDWSHKDGKSVATCRKCGATNSGIDICPLCGCATFVASHTPYSDHPELSTDRHECVSCYWHSDEWPTPTEKQEGL